MDTRVRDKGSNASLVGIISEVTNFLKVIKPFVLSAQARVLDW